MVALGLKESAKFYYPLQWLCYACVKWLPDGMKHHELLAQTFDTHARTHTHAYTHT